MKLNCFTVQWSQGGRQKSVTFPLHTPGTAVSAFVKVMNGEGYEPVVMMPEVKVTFLDENLDETEPYLGIMKAIQ